MRGGRGVINTTPRPFISTWNTSLTSAGSSNSNQIKLPLTGSGLYKFTVNWGDNTSSSISASNQADATHTYASAGIYTLSITGYIKGWYFQSVSAPTDRLKLLSISQWGCLQFTNPNQVDTRSGSFSGCWNLNLTGSLSDTPNFKGITSTRAMFYSCSALNNITNVDKWDTSKISDLCATFAQSFNFDANLGAWNTSKVTDMSFLFNNSTRDGRFNNSGSDSIKNWDTSKVTTIQQVFTGQPLFNQPIGSWNVSNVVSMSFVFYSYGNPRAAGTFNQPLGNWNTGKVALMNSMFYNQPLFDQDIGSWNTSKVTNFAYMFSMVNKTGSFNNGGSSTIGNWDTSRATSMSFMFGGQAKFNQNIGSWNVSNVGRFDGFLNNNFVGLSPLESGAFNNGGVDSLNNWDTSKATTMRAMFSGQRNFNQNIGSWNVSNVTDMGYMFQSLVFNNGGSSSISDWNVSKVTNMSRMFQGAFAFDQPLNNWNVSNVTDFINFMNASNAPNGYSVENYSNLLIGWASRSVKPNISINFSTNKYNAEASASRSILRSPPNNWTIADGGQV